MRFIDGLREDFCAAVLIQRPSDLDTAFVLAKLQDEVAVPSKRPEFKKQEYSYSHKQDISAFVPSSGSSKPDKLTTPIHDVAKTRSVGERWSSLKAYRRAQGLCQHCAEKWTKDHRCADRIQLHALQELLEVMSDDDSPPPAQEQLCLTLSSATVSGTPGPKSMCLKGSIQNQPIKILIDSGSSHSFLNSSLAAGLQGITKLFSPIQVQVANGQVICCSESLSQATWSMGGYQFQTDLKVLPLSSYDMIVGLDWLEAFSPMKVHWKDKWMSIPYQDTTVLLLGENVVLPIGTVLQLYSVQEAVPVPLQVNIPADIQQLIEEFGDLFAVPSQLPPTRACDHSIPLIDGASPVNVRPYRFAPVLKDEIERQIQDMLKSGIIQPSSSSFSPSFLLVKKKDNSWRFCVDYHHLNAITKKVKYPVPIIDELLDELSQASWFTCLDLRAGFHKIRLKPREEFKTTFQTHCGQYEFRVMAFGLTGAPGTFQLAMNSTLAPYLRKFVLVFFDDILIYSRSYAEHVSHLRLVLELLQKDRWHIKLSKCTFAQRRIHYLGHVISDNGVGTDPQKVAAIIEWSVPANAKELRSSLGLAGYYRKFVKNFGVISKPLTELLKKHTVFVWTTDHDAAFGTLKHALSNAPMLALSNFSKQFHIETDASSSGIGAVLMQDGHPLAYISKALGPKSRGLSTYEKEYMAILMAVRQWRPYLQHGEFVIHTDQKSLSRLADQRLHTEWQQKVFTKVLGLQYKVVYKKGVENKVADALSRKLYHSATCFAVSVVTPAWLSEVVDSYQNDDHALSLITKLSVDPAVVPKFILQNGLLRYNNRIWIGNNQQLKHKLLLAFHSSPMGGHSGIPVTYMRMKKLFAWTSLKHSVVEFVKTCSVCEQAKSDRSKLPGKLQPLPVPDSAWQSISMDFVEGLPLSNNVNCILVVVDSFTKYAHFIPLRHPFTAASVAKLFLNNVYKLQGMPVSIVTDRDRIFNSKFWRELFSLAGVELHMSERTL
jgi:hypothetical protein